MSEGKSKTKLAMILGIVVLVAGAAAGIFRAVGCEKGAVITDQVGDAIGELAPDNAEAVHEEPVVAVEETDVVSLASEKCGDITFAGDLLPGDTGPQVRALQTWLKCEGENIDVDGVYGKGTAEAVAKRLVAD